MLRRMSARPPSVKVSRTVARTPLPDAPGPEPVLMATKVAFPGSTKVGKLRAVRPVEARKGPRSAEAKVTACGKVRVNWKAPRSSTSRMRTVRAAGWSSWTCWSTGSRKTTAVFCARAAGLA
jgi:hypothetical protein